MINMINGIMTIDQVYRLYIDDHTYYTKRKELKVLELSFENGNYKFSQDTVVILTPTKNIECEIIDDHYSFRYVLDEDESVENGEDKILREISRMMKEYKKDQLNLRKETEERHKVELLDLETDETNYKKEFLLLNKLRRKDKLLKILGAKINK